MTNSYRYRAFDLEIASQVQLPAFAPGKGAVADVQVIVGPIAEPLDDGEDRSYRNWVARDGLLDLDISGVVRMRIEDGRTIRVEPAEGRSADDAISHIQGSAFAALLQQRGIASMHAGTFETDKGAVLIVGPSGGGKSTLLNAFAARGYRMLADDVTPITLDDRGRPIASPAFPASRLWRDSAEHLGHDVSRLTKVRDLLDKYYVSISGYRDQPLAVAAVVVLSIGAQGPAEFVPSSTAERVKALVRFTFRRRFMRGQQLDGVQFATVSALVAHTRVVHLRRPVKGAPPEKLAGMIVDLLGCAPAGSASAAA